MSKTETLESENPLGVDEEEVRKFGRICKKTCVTIFILAMLALLGIGGGALYAKYKPSKTKTQGVKDRLIYSGVLATF